MGRYSPRRSRSPPRRRPPYDERSSRRHSPPPSGLLVRNISLDARPDDLRIPFERFGPVKDVYLPRNYYTGEPRGFGFVKFRDPEDAIEAKHQMNHTVIGGREITIVFAEENRKTPQEMRTTSRGSGRYGGSHRRRSPPRSPRRRYHSYSRSPSPRHDVRPRDGRDRHVRSRSRSISRSPSPHGEKYSRRPRSPIEADRSPHERRSHKSSRRSPSARDDKKTRSPMNGSRSPSPRGNGRRSPGKAHSGSDLGSPNPRGDGHTDHRSQSPS
ncbi:unnamed protein product [Rhodiola kirilowii]